MTSLLFLSPRRALADFFLLWQFLELASCCNQGSIIRNGNFEDLAGYYPAGVVLNCKQENQEAALNHWIVQDGAIEIISSRLWRGSAANSMYAVHLNTQKGPGAIQTRIDSTLVLGESYLLAFDVASPSGSPAIRRLEISLSSCGGSDSRNDITKSFSFNLPAEMENGVSRRLSWRPIRSVFTFKGTDRCAILRFRSLTPGSRGVILDNIKLSRTSCTGNECERADEFMDSGSREWSDLTGKYSLGNFREKVMIIAETWFRLRFLRRADW